MKKLLFTLLALLMAVPSLWAQDFEVNGIYYNITDETNKTVAVTFLGNSNNYSYYSGRVVIPERVYYNGTTYSVTEIGSAAFRNCSRLTSITIPNSVTTIGSYAFLNCSGLTSITIPNSVTTIGHEAFSACSGLTSVTIPASVTTIGSLAFCYCSSLIEIHITDLAKWCEIEFGNYTANPLFFGEKLYLNGTLVTFLEIPEGVTAIKQYAFYDAESITSISIPNSVLSIGNQSFRQCSNLTSITIGNSVSSIGESAFDNCHDLTAITIPASVTEIGSRAFYYSGLTTVTSLATIPPTIKFDVFWLIPSSSTLYVPAGCKEAYQSAQGWDYFSNIEELTPNNYTLTLSVNNESMGSVTGGGKYAEGSTITFEAKPVEGYTFVRWSDGNTESSRSVVLTQDYSFTAFFAPEGEELFHPISIEANGVNYTLYNHENATIAGSNVEGMAIHETTALDGKEVRLVIHSVPETLYIKSVTWNGTVLAPQGNSYFFTVTEGGDLVIEVGEYNIPAGGEQLYNGSYVESLKMTSELWSNGLFNLNLHPAETHSVYLNFTHIVLGTSFPLLKGSQTPVQMTTTSHIAEGGSLLPSFLFVDWNRDGQFDNSTELVANAGVASRTTFFMTDEVVPAGTAEGLYRARYEVDTDELTPNELTGSVVNGAITVDFDVNYLHSKPVEPDPNDPTGVEKVKSTVSLYYAQEAIHTNAEGEIGIYDTAGNLLRRATEAPVAVGDLVPGVYIVRAGGQTLKFVK